MTLALARISVSPQQAESVKLSRRIRQILDQEDAAIARIAAATKERIRQAVMDDKAETPDPTPAAE